MALEPTKITRKAWEAPVSTWALWCHWSHSSTRARKFTVIVVPLNKKVWRKSRGNRPSTANTCLKNSAKQWKTRWKKLPESFLRTACKKYNKFLCLPKPVHKNFSWAKESHNRLCILRISKGWRKTKSQSNTRFSLISEKRRAWSRINPSNLNWIILLVEI